MSDQQDIALFSWLAQAGRACTPQNPNAPSLIAQKVLKLNKTEQITRQYSLILKPKQLRKLNNLLGRLLKGRPLGAVLGQTEFYHIKLKINARVLHPRAETEAIIDYAIANLPPNAKLIDIGTGSGAIGLAISKARPDLQILLTDVVEHNLRLARRNARLNSVSGSKKILYKNSNLIKNIDQLYIEDSFFVANLPYLNKNWAHLQTKRLKFEPQSALFAGQNGLELIINLLHDLQAKSLLTPHNWILLEHDPLQIDRLKKIVADLGYQLNSISPFISKVSLN